MKTLLLLCSIAVSGALFLTAAPSARAQAPIPAAQTASAEAKPAVHNKSLWEQIKEGGIVMIPIALCSLLTVYLMVDGFLRTTRSRVIPPEHVEELKRLFPPGHYVEAYNYCRDHPSPFTNVCRVAISLIGEGKEVVEEGMLSELAKEDSKTQTYISYLSVIGVCTPMIGLLGTVTGMIKAFATLGTSGIGDPSSLSTAIGEVLVATASGLFIAIPAFSAFYWLRNRAVSMQQAIEETVVMLFRKMPYDLAAGSHIGDERIYAGAPSWTQPSAEGAGETVPA